MADAAYRAQLVALAGLTVDDPNLSIAQLENIAQEQSSESAIRRGLAPLAPGSGVIASGRFVGVTTSGPPASGAWLADDWCEDRTGNIWICVASGTPGSWTSIGSGRELAYQEIVTPFTKPTAGTPAEDVTGLAFTITVGSRPIKLEWWASHLTHDTTNGLSTMLITDNANTVIATQGSIKYDVIGDTHPGILKCRLAPAPGTYTYKMRINAVGGGKPTIFASSTSRSFFQALEL